MYKLTVALWGQLSFGMSHYPDGGIKKKKLTLLNVREPARLRFTRNILMGKFRIKIGTKGICVFPPQDTRKPKGKDG